ncbi:hypothetical protein EMIHUDRAFT_456582 [Emiliania huxleyi CCMP1516]|uniref:Neurotransmitter-gated ion-channel ligand-binding domain-containing protein n=2 Tax=Emiliania huxleyi TaxID=2903 RepID=A0A0D3IK66_EMIH1|nr:hypothetical protein EMIHUDRAFT_465047 [Emiliania huxleyi CCMP1516]XP_005782820.1 hypothetical protein EMIHUDRAFT_456582 [Emiliania huxleyi CCMP1516]EOD11651.1 hypothetical protein EMIHUDRAFT_465047 [Emiliania huxleyi CCMP1516]EOD30391.1 hypothetical protein EMIHUDRAFT_456582 [Emiliania huxleyi CCMP1516]|eukprot:XP_005764080.1 hypothetical protein EMIHUDRAFT_465047 [Emiliania huxleyi CCMP1516]
MGINFHRVHSVDVVNHATDMIVWYRLRWHDPRLVWNASQYGGLTTLQLWVGDGTGAGETSEIWTPDMTLWNQGESMQTSLSSAFASVSSDGTVFWSRPGHLRPTCKFVGLDSFPFDELGCTMEFGSWSFSGLYLRPVKMDAGFSIGGSETAGESFQEFSLERVSCRENVYPPYPGDPENDWPVLLYEVVFQRAWQPYTRGYILLQAFQYNTPPRLGPPPPRLLPSAAPALPLLRFLLLPQALLAAVASDFVIAAKLPAAREMTWFAQFSAFSLAYAAAVLVESCIVIGLYYKTSESLLPSCLRWASRRAAAVGLRRVVSTGTAAAVGLRRVVSTGTGEELDAPTREVSGAGAHAPTEFSRRDANDFRHEAEKDLNTKWQRVACAIDEVARWVVPLSYAVGLACLLAVK